MEYRQLPPPPDLQPWLDCVWLLRGALAREGQTILPDGRLELIFHFGDPPMGQSPSLVTGPSVRAIELHPNGAMDALGIRLRPEAAACLIPCHLLGDAESMDAVMGNWATSAREQLGNGRDDGARIDLVWRLLRSRIRVSQQPDSAVAHSIRIIERTYGKGRMEMFIPPGMGERQWQRRFIRSSGFTPKEFARITRLQHLIGLCESAQRRNWADLALDAGFYDQSHLSNEFRVFTGQSPEAYFRTGRGMAEFHRDGFFQDQARAGG